MRTDSRAWLKDKRVAGYIRESTVAQGKEDRFGPEIQKYAQERAVERFGARPIGRTYIDLVSGTNVLKRSDFQRMVADARVRAFDVLFAYDVSRFARNETDAWVYLDALKDVGVPVYFCDEDILTILDEDWRDQIGAHINAAAAYSRKLSRNVRRGYHRKWDRGGYGGYPPFGYRRTTDGLGLEPNEDAPVRALVIEHYARAVATASPHSPTSSTAMATAVGAGSSRRASSRRSSGTRSSSGCFAGIQAIPTRRSARTQWRRSSRVTPGMPLSASPTAAARALAVGASTTSSAASRAAPTAASASGASRSCVGTKRTTAPARTGSCGTRRRAADVGCKNERKLVASFGEFLARWQLPSDARERIARYLAGRSRSDEILVRRRGFEEQLERIRNLYRWGDMAEDAYLAQRKLLARDLEALPIADDRVPPEEAIALASRVGELWGEMTDDERRRFVEEWFEELRLGRDGTIAVRARETYREIVFSALDAWWRSDPSRQRNGSSRQLCLGPSCGTTRRASFRSCRPRPVGECVPAHLDRHEHARAPSVRRRARVLARARRCDITLAWWYIR